MDENTIKEKVEILADYIMHRCLWQFHSRAWDRERQNAGILGIAKQLLLGEEPDTSTPDKKCYWLDGYFLAKGFRERFEWVGAMSKADVAALMDALKERVDYLTIHGSLNKELTVPSY
jgi:nitrogenase delta subunit